MESSQGLSLDALILLGTFTMIFLVLGIVVFAAVYQKKYVQKKVQLQERELEHQKTLINAMIETKELEQRRIAMELHDDVGSSLTAIRFMLAGMKQKDESIELLNESLQSAITNVRRISNDLLPSVLDEMGLRAAVQSHIKSLPDFVSFSDLGDEWSNLPKNVSLAMYRIMQELVNNILKYAHAENVRIALKWEATHLSLEIEDDGDGFLPDDAKTRSKPSLGLKNIESRVQQIGAEITYLRLPKGTKVTCTYSRG